MRIQYQISYKTQGYSNQHIKGILKKGSTIDGLNYGTFLPGFSKFSGSNDFLR